MRKVIDKRNNFGRQGNIPGTGKGLWKVVGAFEMEDYTTHYIVKRDRRVKVVNTNRLHNFY